MLVLGIETSCDETSIAVVKKGHRILALETFSQIELHKRYGGVVPELASRRHTELLVPLLTKTLKAANCSLQEIDLIAATHAPGLTGALMTGLTFAKTLALSLNKPFVAVHHLQAHLFAALLSHPNSFMKNGDIVSTLFPALGVITSGGHCELVHMEKWGHFRTIGKSIDDAPGEAFDKVAQLLGWSYPGGPIIEKMAKKHQSSSKKNPFTIPRIKKQPNMFSFSGLKTQVYYAMLALNKQRDLSPSDIENKKIEFAYFFQECVIATIEEKVSFLIKESLENNRSTYRSILVGGGVSANERFKEVIRGKIDSPSMSVLWPTKELSLDQAAMVAGAGYFQYVSRGASALNSKAVARESLDYCSEI